MTAEAGQEGGAGGSPPVEPTARGKLWGLPPGRWILTACAVHVVLGLLLFEPRIFTGGDNAGYMILGESLRTGAGYLDLHLPDHPFHTKYPPLYPTVLAVLGWVGGLQLFKVASLAFTTGAVGLTGGLAFRRLGAPAAVAATLVVAVNPVLLDYSHWVLSEAPFVFLVMSSLYGYARDAEDGGRWWWVGLAAACGAFLTRTAGLPLLLAAVALPVLRGQPRRALISLGLTVAVAGGWALFQQVAAPQEAGYVQELLLRDPYRPEAGAVDPGALVLRAAENLWAYVSSIFPASLTGLGKAAGGSGPLMGIAGVGCTGLSLWAWVRRSRRRPGAPELFTFFYVGLLSLWPSVWTDRRFLLPLLPMLVLYLVAGAGHLVSATAGGGASGSSGGDTSGSAADSAGEPTGAQRWLAAGLGAGLFLVAGILDAARVPERIRCLVAYRAGSPCQPAAYTSFFQAARWAAGATPEDAVVVNRKPRLFYWYSGRRGEVYRYVSEPSLVLADMERVGADFVVVDAISATTSRYLVPAVEARPDRFRVVYREGRPPTWVLRFLPQPRTTSRGHDGGAKPVSPAGRSGAR